MENVIELLSFLFMIACLSFPVVCYILGFQHGYKHGKDIAHSL